jgi:VIT1/CCC1 family predicted Fe2+/Mn2+ transporter
MAIYVARGLDPALAKQVAEQLMAHDAIGAHARDELGISRLSVRVRFRLHWHRLAASLLEQPDASLGH